MKHSYSTNNKEEKENLFEKFRSKLDEVKNKNNNGGNNKEPKDFSREKFIEGLKSNKYKRIIVLTGAGISVSAGIPDFRSKGTGLYAKLAAYGLPYPEAVFDINYFSQKPEVFYKLTKEFIKAKAHPTVAHYFIKMLADEEVLYLNFTQNIDGLEVKAGIDPKYMVEAHGHNRSAHCIKCRKEASIEQFLKHVEEEKIYRCDECSGPIKPDITFFGELLPDHFYKQSEQIDQGDLVIVMGTSLQVFPFSKLIEMVHEDVPMVYINRENTIIRRENFLFLKGDIDAEITSLIADLKWQDKISKAREKVEHK